MNELHPKYEAVLAIYVSTNYGGGKSVDEFRDELPPGLVACADCPAHQ